MIRPRPFVVGTSVPRKEDLRLLTGNGRFADDIVAPGQVYASFLRSPHAHADISAIATATAAALPGVLAVLTGGDYVAAGLRGLQQYANSADILDITKTSFAPDEIAELPASLPIAYDRVRHVGEIVAVVIAATPDTAPDAAELIEVDYRPRPAVVDARAAALTSAPQVWDRDNVCLRAERGDPVATAAAFAAARHVIQFQLPNQRIYACPMEPRAALASWDAVAGRYTLQAPSQGVHRYKSALAAALAVDANAIRIVTDDVGGGFGVRSACNTEYALLLWAARTVARPVKWTASRSETFLADFQARDVYAEGAIALDETGRIRAARFDYLGNLGAHPISFAVLANLTRMAGGPYDIPAMHVTVRGVYSNTAPVSVYRGAGRPEVTHILERLIDRAARVIGIDRAELRRRNLIAALPYRSALGIGYDSGAFAACFEGALQAIDWHGFDRRRAAAAARGKRAGIGIVTYLESPSGAPHERTDIRVFPDGRVEAVIGTQASGQGHETSFAQVVSDALQVPIEQIGIVFGDSDRAKSGGGSHSDRSMRLGGTVLVRSSAKIVERGRAIAAHLFEAAVADIGYADGRFTVLGTDRGIGLFEVARAADAGTLPAALAGPLAATDEINGRLPANPNGVAACELEVDPDTGAVAIVRYVTVDDVGRVINPMIVAGQIHGGIAQGIGQALLEHSAYDAETGQLIAGSFMDYGLPRADDFPAFENRLMEVPAPGNPLGVKGAGEAGTTPATAVVISAIVDALHGLGVEHVDMPATPERVWQAIRAARA